MNQLISKKLIVIVDDNAACAEPLQMALESLESVEVRVAEDAGSALHLVSAYPEGVAALITDWRMPSVGGLELLEAMKRDSRLSSIPIVVISGDSDPGLPARVLQGGALAFFLKPYSPLQVKQCLESLIE